MRRPNRSIPKWGGWTNQREQSPGERSFGTAKNKATTSADDIYTDDEREFMLAVEEYKAKSGNKFPQWSVVLALLKSLGYGKRTEEMNRYRTALESILAEGVFDGSPQYFRIRRIAEEALGRPSVQQAHRSLPPRSELPKQRGKGTGRQQN